MIIARYLEQYPEISVYDTYIDNGATGTNFHRPGFQQMLSDIEAGHVNCVIVKDLSRLGRNTIDTGYYIEQYFRILQRGGALWRQENTLIAKILRNIRMMFSV